LTSKTALGLDGDLVTKDNFPLQNLGLKLDAIRQDLHHGKGFGLIRGLDPRKYSVEDLTMIHLGIQVYIANRQGRQDSKGNMLGKYLVITLQRLPQWWLAKMRANISSTVHIVADNSRAAAGHHRHSTAPIVSESVS
jgi:hypothetical protein